MKKGLLTLCLVGLLAMPALAAVPSIGGSPDMTDEDVFSNSSDAAAWSVTVYSYAFVGTGGVDAPDVAMPEPGVGQTLFVYALLMTDDNSTYPASVDQFVVQNPIPANVPAVGFSTTVTPAGFAGPRQNPGFQFSSLEALSVLYSFGGGNTLDPGSSAATQEFSVVYFLADAPPGPVQGSAQGGLATTDVQIILGPVPEPVTLGLMLVGGFFVVRRRKSIFKNGTVAAVAALIAVAGISNSAFATADIGGSPVHVQVNDYNANGSNLWLGKVTSFVYDSSSASVPAGLPTPGPGQTLFAYLVENVGSAQMPAITSWTVANSFPPTPVLSIGTEPGISPTGLTVGGSAQQSNTQIVNPLSQVYTWQNGLILDPPNPPVVTTVLQPDHYSVEWYLVEGTWTLVNGTLQSAAQPETQLVPGPIVPEPASLGLLAVAGLFVARRRR